MQKDLQLTITKFLAVLIGSFFGALIFFFMIFGIAGFFIYRLLN